MAPIRLGFFKLNVPAMAPALAFWSEAFGFATLASFDEAEFIEHILALPDQEGGPQLMLVCYKDGRNVTPGPGHGPVGLMCDDIEAAHRRALDSGASIGTGVFDVAGVRVAVLRSPQGHEVELVQLPAS